ncbi:sulfurtransferase complex subunit TusB [Thalassomonas actiniarum]|uniref:Sulfurtransferase complex subunit TusB n=1 Tax=Thalassomonas actiniarum TaxID=485447 RepID=A0AAE9YM14_9GAMM|nr:sulfurtransferase complex subunit TusB [Thalassomonas actiniarum]WDD96873.1 sulfurtransferase complex subunit TusB [Thalassomonas actiniarum]
MSILHLVRSSQFKSSDFLQCIGVLTPGDHLVLLDDACYNLHHPLLITAQEKLFPQKIAVVTCHAQARAVTLPETITGISMTELVHLTFNNNSVVTWQ